MHDTMKDTKKLHLKVKYKKVLPLDLTLKKYFYNLRAHKKVKQLGLKDLKIQHHQDSHVELEVIGEKSQLWEVIKWSKNVPVTYKVKEISFQFVDVVIA